MPNSTLSEARRWSFSQLDDYLNCGEKFRLKRIEKVPSIVYLNAVAGTAFHEWSADYDKARLEGKAWAATIADTPTSAGSATVRAANGPNNSWACRLDQAIEHERSGTKLEEMRVSGRRTQATPNKEDYTHWRDVLGPDLCEKYVDWVADKVIANGLPPDPQGNTIGIEYELDFEIGGTKVKSFVDRIFEYGADTFLVVDIKAGARKQTTVQLPTYVFGTNKAGIKATHGSLYYARKGTHTDPQDFSRWDENRLSYLYAQAAQMQAQGFYLPRPSEDCSWCSVAAHCRFAL